jgi:RNA polymerase sigma factor (sigma-70 family)
LPARHPGHVESLVRENLDIARREARRWRHFRGVEQADLVSEGSIGLVKAARDFDPSRGVPFRAYATLRVRGAVKDAIRTYVRRARLEDGSFAQTSSLDAPEFDDDTSPRELPDPRATVEEQVIARETLRAVAALPKREAAVVYRNAVLGEHLADIGRDLGISESGAHRLAARGVARLKAAS